MAAARGHLLLIGTGAEIADVLEAWFRAGAADGFNVMPPFFPGQFDAFVDRGRAAPAGARPVPRRLHRHDAARSPRPEAPARAAGAALLIPWNVVGTIWQIFGRSDIGLLGWTLNRLGFDYNYVADPIDAWLTIIVMDVWHWSSLVALLCYAGLKSIPEAYYQAASIDGASRWAVFTAIQLPKMKHVLVIAVLLRFIDSFMIYTEPFVVTGGGPGNSTTFLSIELVKLALGQFDLGKAAAMSIVYMLIIIIVCWVFFTVMTNAGQDRQSADSGPAGGEP